MCKKSLKEKLAETVAIERFEAGDTAVYRIPDGSGHVGIVADEGGYTFSSRGDVMVVTDSMLVDAKAVYGFTGPALVPERKQDAGEEADEPVDVPLKVYICGCDGKAYTNLEYQSWFDSMQVDSDTPHRMGKHGLPIGPDDWPDGWEAGLCSDCGSVIMSG